MARRGKLLAALDAHKGRDIEAEKRKKQVKEAEKRKRVKAAKKSEQDDETPNGNPEAAEVDVQDGFASFSDNEGEDDEGVDLGPTPAANGMSRGEDEDHDLEEEDEESEDSDVPLSDVSESELEDTIPHQRLTINNGPALLASQSRVALLRKQPSQNKVPFYIHNSLISDLPPSDSVIPDANDDLTRELEFYRIARTAALEARRLLKSESIPFTRPADYFAEMVKSASHMDKIKNKMRDEAAGKKGREEARRQRDAKKFGKQVQIAKEQERAKVKRDVLDKVKDLKRKRKNNPSEDVRENPEDSLFESISVEDPSAKSSSGRDRGGGFGSGRGDRGGSNFKRQKKDAKFGFGGKKRFAKSGDAVSAGDMRDFSTSRMKGRGGRGGGEGRGGRGGGGRGGGISRGGSKRLGKSRRMASR